MEGIFTGSGFREEKAKVMKRAINSAFMLLFIYPLKIYQTSKIEIYLLFKK
jgi:hypothetical protein